MCQRDGELVEKACGRTGLEEDLTVVMMRVRRSVRAALREAAREEGLSQNEIEVLLFLTQGRFDTARDISRLRGMPRSLVSKAVDQLMQRGYVAACQDQRDRRVMRLRLLPKAQPTVDKLLEGKRAFFARLCRGVTSQEAQAFYSMVGKMVLNLDKEKSLEEEEEAQG